MASTAHNEVMDELLEKYLGLLDQYTTLRKQLSELQANVYHSLARANFSVERGVRYGQDFYDDRMQASALLTCLTPSIFTSSEILRLDLVTLPTTFSKSKPTTPEPTRDTGLAPDTGKLKVDDDNEKSKTSEAIEGKKEPTDGRENANKGRKEPVMSDPVRMFGLLTPPALRQAQASAKSLVGIAVQVINIDAQMRGLEIEARRARKRKSKAGREVAVDGKDRMAKEEKV